MADAAGRGDKAAFISSQGRPRRQRAHCDGMSALHWAAERGDVELADILIFAGANIGAVTRIGQYTPLHLAAQAGNAAVAKALLKAGADVNAKTTNSGVTAVHLAASSGSAELINLLADAKADLNATETEAGQTPLIFAAGRNRAEAIKTLIARGANPGQTTKVVDIAKFNALDRAAADHQRKVLEGFVGKGSEAKPTPSQVAAAIEAGRQIVLSGKVPARDPNAPVDPNVRNFNPEEINPPVATKGGMTALLHASRQGYIESAAALLDGGAISIRSTSATATPAADRGDQRPFTCDVASERGANPNHLQRDGSPLWAEVNPMWQPAAIPAAQEMACRKKTTRRAAGVAARARTSITDHDAPLVSRVHRCGIATAAWPPPRARRRSGARRTARPAGDEAARAKAQRWTPDDFAPQHRFAGRGRQPRSRAGDLPTAEANRRRPAPVSIRRSGAFEFRRCRLESRRLRRNPIVMPRAG